MVIEDVEHDILKMIFFVQCLNFFVYGGVSSNNDLNQLMFIIENNRLFM